MQMFQQDAAVDKISVMHSFSEIVIFAFYYFLF